jgi:hypothetical protein
VLLAVIVRDGPVACSDATWTKVIDGVGASGLFLDGYARIVDGTAGSRSGDVVSFFSPTEQELQGSLVIVTSAKVDGLIEAISHGAFLDDDLPGAPAIDSMQKQNTIMCVWSMDGEVSAVPPSGMSELDAYSSSEFSSRTLLVARRSTIEAGEIFPGEASLSAAVSGRSWSIAVRWVPPPTVIPRADTFKHLEEALLRLPYQMKRIP